MTILFNIALASVVLAVFAAMALSGAVANAAPRTLVAVRIRPHRDEISRRRR